MLKRIWHALVVGHQWKTYRESYAPGTDQVKVFGIRSETDRYEVYGFTTEYSRCECGATKKYRTVGIPEDKIEGSSEIEQLRKMAGLQ
jgi:hypothetical protein